MNKIYKIIWSKTVGAYVVTSELAKSHTKNQSRKGLRRSIAAALVAALVAAPASFGVYAATDIHYVSIKSDNQTADSNYNNDNANAADSIIIGIGSTSEGINSTVIGNNNKLTGNTSYLGDDGKEVKVNNSIVAGQNLEVEGYSNTVFATEATDDMRFQRQTKVAGDHNTVIGAGNLVRYKKEDDGTYTKLGQDFSSNKNVVIGSLLTVSGSDNVVLGHSTEFKLGEDEETKQITTADQVTAIGTGNRIGSEAREGVAIGSELGINGHQTVAIGFASEAKAKSAISIGQWNTAEGENAISIGNESHAYAKNSIAIGGPVTEGPPGTGKPGASATAEGGVALGAVSVADREAGMAGYLSNGKTTAEWQATLGALSVGVVSDEWTDTRQITGVAAGTENTDAVNVAQLKKVESNVNDKVTVLNGRVDRLGTRVDRVGAGAAALAGLHPLDYDPDDKWDFAAGYGNYSGANAIAIGAFYRPNENQMFSIGGSFGGGENMVNAGISVKLGQGTGVSTSKVAMAKEIKNLKTENERMQEENKEMKQEIEVLKEQMQKLLAGK